MFKRLKRWLCGPEKPTVRRQLLAWLRERPECRSVAMPPDTFTAFLCDFDLWERELIPTQDLAGGRYRLEFEGVEIYPDPSVTEFTSR